MTERTCEWIVLGFGIAGIAMAIYWIRVGHIQFVVRLARFSADRRTHPFDFWFAVVFYAGVSAAMIVAAVVAMCRNVNQ